MERKYGKLLQGLYWLLCLSFNLLFASKTNIPTKPAATKEGVDAYFQSNYAGLYATMSQRPPIGVPTELFINRLAGYYGKTFQEKATKYYGEYGITYEQAVQLYQDSGQNQQKFRDVYSAIKNSSGGSSMQIAVGDYLSQKKINQLSPAGQQRQPQTGSAGQQQQQPTKQGPAGQQPQRVVPGQKPAGQPGTLAQRQGTAQQPRPRPGAQQSPQPVAPAPIEPPVDDARFDDNYYQQYGITLAQARRLNELSRGNFKRDYDTIKQIAARDNLKISAVLESKFAQTASKTKQLMEGASQLSSVASISSIEPPIAGQVKFDDNYYKPYGITASQAQRLYLLSGNDATKFKIAYNNVRNAALQSNTSIKDMVDVVFAKIDSSQDPIPGRPVKNVWTRSIFSYIPAGGIETIESRADMLAHKAGHLASEFVTRPLGALNLWTESEFLDKGGYMIKNPDAGKKFTLLDAVDAVLAYPLVRFALEQTIIGPLDKNKDLKMKQFIMLLLVTHYNNYKLMLSPLGALNLAVNRILLPIRTVSSVGTVSMFLMRQALSVFNQYNLNGGTLKQALYFQASNLILGRAGSIISGAGRVVSGVAGAVRRGAGALFKSK